MASIAKWTERFEASERLIANKDEAEQRLRDVHKIEQDTLKADYEKVIEEWKAKLGDT